MVGLTMSEPTPPPRKTNPLAVVIATGLVILHNRRYRRNLLFGLTLVTLLWTFVGAAFIGGALMQRPVAFTIYWLVCFLLVLALSVMALYDLMRVRKDHHREQRKLEERMGAAMDEIKAMAQAAEQEGEGKLEDGAPKQTTIDAVEIEKSKSDHDSVVDDENRA